MDPRLTQKATELGELLRESKEYQVLQQAQSELAGHSAANIMLRDLQQKQETLQRKQLNGEKITQAEIDDWQRTTQVVSMNPYVREFMAANEAFRQLVEQVQLAILQAAGLYAPEPEEADTADTDEAQAEAAKKAEEEAARKARSRLWVPGK